MKPIFMNDKWYIEVYTKEFGKVLLLDNNQDLPIPMIFDAEKMALEYIEILMHQMEAEVVDVLSGSEGVEWNDAVKIAKATYGDMNAAKIAAIQLRRGWTIDDILDSLKRR